MTAPVYDTLTAETAAAYAAYLAAKYGTTVAGEGKIDTSGGVEAYVFPLADGTAATVWMEGGRVYGEA